MIKRYGKKALIALAIICLVAQFIRPAKNQSGDNTAALDATYSVPENVMSVLKPACYDCHSNYTRYPWYAEVQPLGWWLAQHVKEGKKHLNFSSFTARKLAVQYHKFEEIVEVVKEKEMPLGSYTWTHADARLTDTQRSLITDWAQAMMDHMQRQYPADSLVLKRK